MQPPFPSPVATWHNDTYDTINPSNPELSQTGKTVVITGAGSGIGRATAIAFATAGCDRLVLIGRTASTLRETANLVPGKSKIEIYATSVTDEVKMKEAAEGVGAWDILVLGAANIIPLSSVADVDLGEWWKQYEVSVKSIVVVTQAFMPRAKNGASIYGITSSALVMPPALLPGYSAYLGAKMAQVKVLEFLANEMRESNVVSVHPGIVDTKMMRSGGGSPEHLPMDTVELPAHFLVWLSQPKTKFLNGKMIWANWDVNELEAQAEEIKGSRTMTVVYEGYEKWPFGAAQ